MGRETDPHPLLFPALRHAYALLLPQRLPLLREPVRMKTWRPALLVLLLLLAAAAEGEQTAAKVEVRLSEYTFGMPHTLPAGPTVFLLRNQGQKSHSFKIEGPGIEEVPAVIVKPGKDGTLQVTLQPGEYKVYCPIGSHAAKGMTMTLVVGEK